MKPFSIYLSSAGSGKTRTLAKAYISLALGRPRNYFRHILAVTFTNKATQEMKSRIIQYLNEFANKKKNNLSSELCEELNISETDLQIRSKEVLFTILHQYSQFSITTIDAFFQRIIRSFIREAGMVSNFHLELDNNLVLEKVIEELMLELGKNKDLTKWMVKYSEKQLNESRNWNIKKNLMSFSTETSKESFKDIEDAILKIDKKRNENILSTLIKIETDFLDFMQPLACQAIELIKQNNLDETDFKYGIRGTPFKYFTEFSNRKYITSQSPRLQISLENSSLWARPKSSNQARFTSLVDSHLMSIFQAMVEYDKDNIVIYKTANLLRQQFYNLILVEDILKKLNEYKINNNLMLLSDASHFINSIIDENDTPFIYEKVGEHFKHYLIDEFQDTSGLQWKNFKPLIKESGDQQCFNLIVGDVKQSIYRWRAGNIELMQHRLLEDLGKDATKFISLDTNYRSAGNIVDFNNYLFAKVAHEMKSIVNDELPAEVFKDVEQKKFRFPRQGFVRINFLDAEHGDGWKADSLQQIPTWIESLYQVGAEPKDIAILVDRHKEGRMVTDFLLQYSASSSANKNYSYAVVSNESLLIMNNWAINVLVNSMHYLLDDQNLVAGGQLAFELSPSPNFEVFNRIIQNSLIEELPKEFIMKRESLLGFSLFELVEELIKIFKLDHHNDDYVYLQAFQDLILEFSNQDSTDISSFLEWWENHKGKKSIQVSSDVNAIKVLTIHKAKGLQFKYVIIPFCDWKLNHTHPPLLWHTINKPHFKNTGPLPIKYSKDLEETYFADQYQNEFVKVHVDNLNKLYVAFTRAEEGLMIIAPQSKNISNAPMNYNSVSKIVYQAIKTDESLNLNFQSNTFSLGTMEQIYIAPTSSESDACELTTYYSTNWREKLIIQKKGIEFFDQNKTINEEKLNFGIFLHSLLAKIIYADDTEQAFKVFSSEHSPTQSIVKDLREKVSQILENKYMKGWFSKKWKVRTEAEVLLPNGGKKRFDRIMQSPTQTIIVDYKTGNQKNFDITQLNQYVSILRKMGYPNVEAFLVYVQEIKIVKYDFRKE